MILVTGASRLSAEHLRDIEESGRRVAFMQQENEQLPVSPSEVEAVMCNSLFDHQSVDDFSRLRLVQATSAGLDRMPIASLESKGVAVEPARGVYSPAMAEFVMLLILQLYKKGSALRDNQNRKIWEKERDLRELTGRSACIVGYGSVGREVASRLRAFGVSIMAIGSATANDVVDEMLSAADIVVLSLPLTASTVNFLSSRRLSLMRSDSVLINVSRGQIVDEAALIEQLHCGRFFGVGLDVFESEPLDPSSALWSCGRVIVTPHNSFVSDRSADRLVQLFLNNIGKFL